jgi:16S rRNA (cytosine1402-N4)-methyltransferase
LGVALEHLFQGSALNAVDAKGRVSIPAFLRVVIERRGDARTIVLAKHEAFPCLSAYDPAYAALKHAKLERLLEKEETSPDAQLEYQQRNLMAFAATEEVPYDSSGRILFPPMMRRKGQIGAVPRHGRDLPDLEPRHSPQGASHPRGPQGHRPFPPRRARRVMTSTGASVAPHVPVLVSDVIAALALSGGETVLDGTFGAGGYTRAMLSVGAGRVIGFDRDPDAIEAGRSLVPDHIDSGRLELIQENFSQMDRVLAERGIGQVDAIALDIGVSSMQIDRAERGFSFQADGPLDMRMSKSGRTAAEFLNSADEGEIVRVLRDYGEEPRARAIARAIVAARPVERTGQLAAIVRRAAGFRPGHKSDPATRTFQAIRIHLNAELDELEQGLEAAERALKPGGRLAVVTFHSLEDRIVKRFLRERSGGTPAGSRHRPAVSDPNEPTFEQVAKPVSPSEREQAANPRARSARLRSAIRTSAPSRNHKSRERLQ